MMLPPRILAGGSSRSLSRHRRGRVHRHQAHACAGSTWARVIGLDSFVTGRREHLPRPTVTVVEDDLRSSTSYLACSARPTTSSPDISQMTGLKPGWQSLEIQGGLARQAISSPL